MLSIILRLLDQINKICIDDLIFEEIKFGNLSNLTNHNFFYSSFSLFELQSVSLTSFIRLYVFTRLNF